MQDTIVRLLAARTPDHLKKFRATWIDLYDDDLPEYFMGDQVRWGAVCEDPHFRTVLSCLLRGKREGLPYLVRNSIRRWSSNMRGCITILSHLPEVKRQQLIDDYSRIPGGGDLLDDIRQHCGESFQYAILSMVRPAAVVIAEHIMAACRHAQETGDHKLLINWMVMAKDRMEEVRAAFQKRNDQTLHDFLNEDCPSKDYKEVLLKLSLRECLKITGSETGACLEAPVKPNDCVLKFNKAFNESMYHKRKKTEDNYELPEEIQQEMVAVFMHYTKESSCAPNLDKRGVWELTNVCGFPPADDGPDLDATFNEWDFSGTGEITWNDFMKEIKTRVNDPNHYEADPLPEGEVKDGKIHWQPLTWKTYEKQKNARIEAAKNQKK